MRFLGKYVLLAPGFESMTFQLLYSSLVIPFLAGICISPIDHHVPIGTIGTLGKLQLYRLPLGWLINFQQLGMVV